MKQRFSSLDVKVAAHELSQGLVGLRLANIYDISSKKILLKFAVAGKREQLLIDSGFRTHLTEFTRATAAAPSAFTARLRKFLKTRRCSSISQVGTDRIMELQFSDGAYRLYLEFFAAGNVILTDADLKILAILRNVSEGEGQEPQRAGLTYSLENRQNYGGVPPLVRERVRGALSASVKKAEAAEAALAKKKHKRKPGDELRRGLTTSLEELPPVVVDHAFAATGFEPTVMPGEVLENDVLFEALFHALEEARRIVDEVTSAATCKGYIVARKRDAKGGDHPSTPEAEKAQGLLYEDFQPFLPHKYEHDPQYTILTFDSFNKTLDEFFSSIEGQKLEARLSDREATAKRKLEAVRAIQEQKVEGLKTAQILNLRKAGAIEANADRVAEAIDAVNGLISQGMDWVNIGKLIAREQKRHNAVAEIIKLPLDLERNMITLLLAEEEVDAEEHRGEEADGGDDTSSEDSEEDANEEEELDKEDKAQSPDNRLVIEINLGLTPFANARDYYDQKKVAAVKEQRTVEQSVAALKSAEKKIVQDLKKGLKQEKPTLQPTRRQMWFEKFLWFISSDGYLVVGGRDASQNEMLYRKHLGKGDIYVHADMHGAASVIIKNNPKTPDAPVPPATLAQAGSLSVCSSNAWDSKAGMGAWWVNAEQVSKSAPTGEYLPTGSFMVRGNKNILTPQPLVLGFGFVFKISEESKANHVKHRLVEADESQPAGARGPIGHIDGGATKHRSGEFEQVKDGADESEEEQDEVENHDRRNPLQTNVEQEEEDDEDEGDAIAVHDDDDEDLDGDFVDHVKDDYQKLSIGEPAEAMMSGALVADATADGGAVSAVENGSGDQEDDTGTGAPDGAISGTAEEKPAASETTADGSVPQNNGAPAKRGRRAKQKKIAAKYKDQDEEDRAMHEQLIGAAKGRQKAEEEARAKVEKQAEEEARRERRRQAQEKQKQKTAEHEEMRRLMLDEGLEVLDDSEEQAVTPLDALIGTPLPGDEILQAIPVCAPWAAMSKCKYKVKIQPGPTKKGKAIKEMLERWKVAATKRGSIDEQARDPERMWPREVELIKSFKPEEGNNVVPVGKMTIMMTGGTAGGKKAGGGGGGGGGSKGGGKGGAKQGKGGRGGKGGKKN
ncbi:hypothetical protein M406DRAFT_352095 [Cryphonectria parasitica EP155]|uniref:Ribosome quality control complex subunit 2 n=1 Tax=Cryphonectria parasitica (strain ATCC 38755 / EP155) TaxID=660469 RepID=A0A9P4Y1B3_CRYP1|nr:uncharacterized protein M406DRAFT_352095 [Cryphonectria parasitica EP155]KAF3765157.1 hypothetical protein M406DRAFT_352095 [Cryphonectria parasitica EP155]